MRHFEGHLFDLSKNCTEPAKTKLNSSHIQIKKKYLNVACANAQQVFILLFNNSAKF